MAKKNHTDTQEANEIVREILDAAYYTFSVEAMDGSGKQPGSKAEVEAVKDLMSQARELNPDDPQLLDEMSQFEAICTEAYERRFVGFKWLIYIVGVYALIWMWTGFSNLGDKKNYTPEYVTPLYQADIEGDQAYIARYDTAQNMDRSEKKYLQKRKKSLDEKLAMNMDDYAKLKKRQANKRAYGNFKTALWWLIITFLYYKASLAPVFLINKRQRQIHLIMTGAGWFKRIVFFFLGLFIALPVTEDYKLVERGTGRVLGSGTEISPMLMIKIFGILIIAVFMLMIALYSTPILTLVGFLRNYKYEQVDAFFDKALSTIKGWLNLA